MNYIKREMEKTLLALAKEYSCIILTGARQVGKSTMLEHIFNGHKSISLDDLQG